MNNYNTNTSSGIGFKKEDISGFVDYVIQKTEENIVIIKNQKEEIARLQDELATYKRLENNYYHLNRQAEDAISEMKSLAKKESEMLLSEAKNNANKIVNDALLKSAEIKKQQDSLNRSIYNYKKKIRNMLIEQLQEIEEIEIL